MLCPVPGSNANFEVHIRSANIFVSVMQKSRVGLCPTRSPNSSWFAFWWNIALTLSLRFISPSANTLLGYGGGGKILTKYITKVAPPPVVYELLLQRASFTSTCTPCTEEQLTRYTDSRTFTSGSCGTCLRTRPRAHVQTGAICLMPISHYARFGSRWVRKLKGISVGSTSSSFCPFEMMIKRDKKSS